MNKEFIQAVEDISKEKGIDAEQIYSAIEEALKTGLKKKFGDNENIRVEMNRETGEIKLFAIYRIVEGTPKEGEISLDVARESNPDFMPDDVIERPIYNNEIGRMAALTAKQIMMQRLREAEQNYVNDYFRERQSNVVIGFVQRVENGNIYLDLGKVDAVLLRSEQIPGEKYEIHSRKKVYILDVRRTKMGPQVIVSRTHPGLLRRLLEEEVPEIADGVVELKSVAREPGSRSKISVFTKEKDLDAVGACVGPRGIRIQNIVNELGGEKIDVVQYSENPAEYVANALSPSKVVEANANETEKICKVVVPDYQLSLAIGKEGQNARLAAKLTNWKIDIKSESQAAEADGQEETQQETETTETTVEPETKQELAATETAVEPETKTE